MHYYPLSVLAASWIFWIWEMYLSIRQFRVYLTTKKVPAELEGQIDEKTFLKAKAYSIDRAKYKFVSSIINQIQSTLIICYYLLPYFWNISGDIMVKSFYMTREPSIEREIFQSLVFTFITSLASTIINLPLCIYNTFVIEERHGFNKQTAGFYVKDKTKKFFVSYIIQAPIVAAIIYIVRNGGPYFFLYLWMFCFVVVCILILFHGEIAALFDKFTPLPEGELRKKIEALAESIGFPLHSIFVVEGSKRSSHSNAYQSGFFNKKRIVIYDTLIQGYYDDKKTDSEKVEEEEKSGKNEDKKAKNEENEKQKGCNHDEILAVLCHELGHWYCSHLIKNLTFAEVNYFFMFVIFSKFYQDPAFYASFGFIHEMPVIIGFALLMMVLTPYNELLGFVSVAMSRKFEYQADEFAASKGHAQNLQTSLVKLNIDNLGFPVHDELYSKFNHSHPTLMQRLKALSKYD